MEKIKIEIWSDVMCPFCYIGKRRLEQAVEKLDFSERVDIEWKSFQLDPGAPKTSELDPYDYLAKRYGNDRKWSIEMHDQVTANAKKDGLDYRFDLAVVSNSLDAHKAAHFAKENGQGDAFEEALFRSYFTEGKNISDEEFLVNLATDLGLDESGVRQAIHSDEYKNKVQNEIMEAQQMGVKGVPFFVFDRKYAVSGAQPVDAFVQTLEHVLAEKA